MTKIDAGSLDDLRKTGRLLTKLGTQPVCVLWDGEAAYAVDDPSGAFEDVAGGARHALHRRAGGARDEPHRAERELQGRPAVHEERLREADST